MTFAARPTFEQHEPQLHLTRTPPKGMLSGWITSTQPIAAKTHFFGGRTMPCSGKECIACQAKRGSRWHAYVAFFNLNTKRHEIFECTGEASRPLYEWIDAGHQLRTARMIAERKANRRNAAVIITLTHEPNTSIKLPTEPSLEAQLQRIWRLNGSREEALEPGIVEAVRKELREGFTKIDEQKTNGQATH